MQCVVPDYILEEKSRSLDNGLDSRRQFCINVQLPEYDNDTVVRTETVWAL